ncbi:hypothetical protein, partial [Burkholderia sp.]|uniref:hypothetical protein n=1 Tax=Burkholderia sp. TaxID=36773 RepID=UPI0025860C39
MFQAVNPSSSPRSNPIAAPGQAGMRAAHREIECAASRHLIGLGRHRPISWPHSLPMVAPRRLRFLPLSAPVSRSDRPTFQAMTERIFINAVDAGGQPINLV